jgi:endogenous inhibitor of DNA gyrase (YacG/DUF329 family)
MAHNAIELVAAMTAAERHELAYSGYRAAQAAPPEEKRMWVEKMRAGRWGANHVPRPRQTAVIDRSERRCPNCGATVVNHGRVSNKVYCSARCSERMPILRSCLFCGVAFRPWRGSSRGSSPGTYCSKACAGRNQPPRPHQYGQACDLRWRTCATCAAPFCNGGSGAVLRKRCDSCMIRAPSAERPCTICGRMFVPSHGSSRRCSQQCRDDQRHLWRGYGGWRAKEIHSAPTELLDGLLTLRRLRQELYSWQRQTRSASMNFVPSSLTRL